MGLFVSKEEETSVFAPVFVEPSYERCLRQLRSNEADNAHVFFQVLSEEFLEALQHNTSARHVRISVKNIQLSDFRVICNVLKKNEGLRSVFFADVVDYYGVEGMELVLDVLHHNDRISSVDIKFHGLQATLCAAKMADFLSSSFSSSLTSLSCGEYPPPNDDVVFSLVSSLRHNSSLQVLDLHLGHALGRSWKELSEALKKNRTLTHLNVAQAWDDVGTEFDFDFLKLNLSSALTYLDLSWFAFTSEGRMDFFLRLFEALHTNVTLRSLVLNRNNLQRAGVMHLTQLLQKNTTLTHLELGEDHFGQVSTKEWSDFFRANQSVTHLSLARGELTQAALMEISHHLRHYDHLLQHLDVSEIFFGPMALSAATKAMEENGTLCQFRVTNATFQIFCTRNVEMRNKVRQLIATLMALNKRKNKIIYAVPKELLQIIAKYIWKTKSDVQAWGGS